VAGERQRVLEVQRPVVVEDCRQRVAGEAGFDLISAYGVFRGCVPSGHYERSNAPR